MTAGLAVTIWRENYIITRVLSDVVEAPLLCGGVQHYHTYKDEVYSPSLTPIKQIWGQINPVGTFCRLSKANSYRDS